MSWRHVVVVGCASRVYKSMIGYTLARRVRVELVAGVRKGLSERRSGETKEKRWLTADCGRRRDLTIVASPGRSGKQVWLNPDYAGCAP